MDEAEQRARAHLDAMQQWWNMKSKFGEFSKQIEGGQHAQVHNGIRGHDG